MLFIVGQAFRNHCLKLVLQSFCHYVLFLFLGPADVSAPERNAVSGHHKKYHDVEQQPVVQDKSASAAAISLEENNLRPNHAPHHTGIEKCNADPHFSQEAATVDVVHQKHYKNQGLD